MVGVFNFLRKGQIILQYPLSVGEQSGISLWS